MKIQPLPFVVHVGQEIALLPSLVFVGVMLGRVQPFLPGVGEGVMS